MNDMNLEIFWQACKTISDFSSASLTHHVGWIPCHYSMAHPQVADGGKASSYGG